MESAYRLMWMMVMFDLPTLTKAERKRAHDFRQYLLDEGFQMAQLSVYLRFVGSREKIDAMSKRIAKNVPSMGNVRILCFTDKQFGTIQTFSNAKYNPPPEKPDQLQLF
jgi:CRISPR-associated protein Cas2